MAGDVQDVVIVSGVRTAIGDFGGGLKDIAPARLGALVIAEAVRRAGLRPDDVQHVVMGQVIQSEPRDAYLARVCAIEAGIPVEAPALTLNRLCGSGVQSVVSAAQMIMLGECSVAVAGGAESMSRSPHVAPGLRWGVKMGDAALVDALIAVLSDPFGHGHMGMTAENVAARFGIDRRTQDEYAVESHRRAGRAIADGRFESQILPIEVKDRKGVRSFATDEHVRADVTLESVASLQPAFRKDGTVTPANASGINDGAAAIVLMAAQEAKRRGLRPMARIRAWGHAGVAPEVMGLGPIPAVPKALERAGLDVTDLDVIESNEAFAVQACAVARELRLPPERTNPNGGAVAFGHPVGATGTILIVKTLYELERTDGRYGLVTMCIGGGQGIALVIEREQA